ncbi:MAG: hypothetical protein WCF92_00470 [bacterium]
MPTTLERMKSTCEAMRQVVERNDISEEEKMKQIKNLLRPNVPDRKESQN